MQFLRAHTDRPIKMTVPGPFTMAQQAQNDYYPSEEAAALDYAAAVNEEIRDLFAAGADIVQVDEPYMQARPEKARAVRPEGAQPRAGRHHRDDGGAHLLRLRRDHPPAARRATRSCPSWPAAHRAGVDRDGAVRARLLGARTLAGKHVMVGCLDLNDPAIESPETVVRRIERALPYIEPEQVILAPDCGMKYLPRDVAFGKLAAMVAAARQLRAAHGG